MLADHDPFEDLNPLFVPFLDERVDANAVTGSKLG
jgi:hypothetical protein